MKRAMAAVTLLTITSIAAATPSHAADSIATGREFGEHLVDCAQSVGLNGIHNPGMHDGFAGWDGTTCVG